MVCGGVRASVLFAIVVIIYTNKHFLREEEGEIALTIRDTVALSSKHIPGTPEIFRKVESRPVSREKLANSYLREI